MKLSYVIVTYNRREALLKTLRHLVASTPLPRDQWETWVVDNASTDGTAAVVAAEFPEVNFIARPTNEGVGARSRAFEPATGEYVILLDDDSYPIGDAVSRSINYLDANRTCAAVVGKVLLPDDTEEGCAFPAVMISCAVCIRRQVLLDVGGFRPEFFRKAGEYDISYRIWNAGHTIERFDDVVYRHDKVLAGRSKAFAHRMDLRNNLILVERYLPAPLRRPYREDTVQRYAALARKDGCGRAALRARIEAFGWRFRERWKGRQTLSPQTVESLYELESQARKVRRFAEEHGVRSVAIHGLSKNLYATWNACKLAGLDVRCIADDNPGFYRMNYRGAPVVLFAEAMRLFPDAFVISNLNPARAPADLQFVLSRFAGPVLPLWSPTTSGLPRADAEQAQARRTAA